MDVGHLPDRRDPVHGDIIMGQNGVLGQASFTGLIRNVRVQALPPSGATRGGSPSTTQASRPCSKREKLPERNEEHTR